MWASSRKVVLIAAGVLMLGGAALGSAWLAKKWPIQWGAPATGELVADADQAEQDHSTQKRLPEILPEYSGQAEPLRQQEFVAQSEPAQLFDVVNTEPAIDPSVDDRTTDLFAERPARARNSELTDRFAELDAPRNNDVELDAVEPRRLDPRSVKPTRFDPLDESNDILLPSETTSKQPSSNSDFQSTNGAEPRSFEPESPRSLQPARNAPVTQQVALLDRFQNSDPPDPLEAETPAASTPQTQEEKKEEPAKPVDQPVPAPMKDDFEFEASPKSKTASQSTTVEPRVAARTETEPNAKVDLRKIDALIEKNDLVAAHRELSTLYWNQPEVKPTILPRLEKTAHAIYFASQPHFVEPYVIQSGDKLERIGPKYQITWQYLSMVNKVDPRRIQVGKKLKVIKGPFAVFVDLSDFELTVHAHGFFVKRYQVGVGKDGASPIGKFAVLEKVEKPQYTDPNGNVIAGGAPTNPLGTHWIDIGNSYGIHGTIEPDSIGKAESRGCIRMRNEDVAEVYNFLIKGSEVVIRQ